jgi:hypothetical protein
MYFSAAVRPMALLPVCSTLNWKADGNLPLRAVVQLELPQYVRATMNGPGKYLADRLSEGHELIVCQCPACKMFSWHKSQSRERKICPFCSDAQPDYLTRIVPETVTKVQKLAEETNVFPTRLNKAGHPGDCDNVSPFVLEFFMVQGSGFRCMAYRNQEGKWRGAFDDEELPGAIRVLG